MMAGMDDKEDLDDDITLEAMSGLSKVLAEIEENQVRAILINITLRIRPCFEKVCIPCLRLYFCQLHAQYNSPIKTTHGRAKHGLNFEVTPVSNIIGQPVSTNKM